MSLWERLKSVWIRRAEPVHLRHGKLGERAAKRHLKELGLKFLTANYATRRGEIDLIFREGQCLVFVEVKTRSSETWTRPATAVDKRKRRLLSLTALEYVEQWRRRGDFDLLREASGLQRDVEPDALVDRDRHAHLFAPETG